MTPSVSRRRFSFGLATASAALSAGAARAQQVVDDARDIAAAGAFDVAEATLGRPQPDRAAWFDLSEVKLGEGPFRTAQAANIAYMKRLDPDRLLHTFRLNAGLPSSAEPLGGWEEPNGELRGHSTGHYLSGLALAYRATGDTALRDRGHAMVAVLAACQTKLNQGGYLSAFPLELFERLDQRRDVWAPFYTIHKIMAGLFDMHQLAGDPQALTVLTGMAQWTDAWTASKSEPHMQAILDTEFGGMNEVLYNLAAETGDPRWITVGDRFTKKRVFNPLAARRDELQGLHMNTHVPQVIGAARRMELTGDARYGEVARFFYETVTDARTYATGGSSNSEHWLTGPYQLAAEWPQSDHHQECCCSYNMMKLGTHLFRWKPDARLADYHERNLLNHRIGMIEPESGRSSYFLSVSPGAWKTIATETDSFWCCNGTALEDFSKIPGSIYAHEGRTLYVNLFVPSELDARQLGVRLRQETTFPATPRTRLVVTRSPATPWMLKLRVPGWADGGVTVRVNGRAVDAGAEPGTYLELTRAWKTGDTIEMDMPMTLRFEAFPDAPDVRAVVYGPVVLAQQLPLGDVPANLRTAQGPNLAKAPPPVAPVSLPADTLARLKPVPGEALAFALDAPGGRALFKPVSESWERFAVYMPVGRA